MSGTEKIKLSPEEEAAINEANDAASNANVRTEEPTQDVATSTTQSPTDVMPTSANPPDNPEFGDEWFDTTTNKTFAWIDAGDSTGMWAELIAGS